MSVPRAPGHAAEITPEWLTLALRAGGAIGDATVVDAHVEAAGPVHGYLSHIARVRLDYDLAPPGAPDSVVVKMETDPGDMRDFSDEVHAFEREIRFYREIAPHTTTRVPRFYHGAADGPAKALVVEDLSRLRPGDQAAGVTAHEAEATARSIAHLHAAFWDNERLARLAWLPRGNGFHQGFDENWASFVEHFAELATPAGVEAGNRLVGRVPRLLEAMRQRPHTTVHSDLRADNLMFGEPTTPEEVVILDWQLVVPDIGAFDVARLVAGSERLGERTGHELDVLRGWHETLLADGVTGYRFEDALHDFKLGVLFTMCVIVFFHWVAIDGGPETQALIEGQYPRICGLAAELDAPAALDVA